jgi:phosphohistidine swiveling domain-containing protein
MAAGVSTAMTGLRDGEPIRLDGDRGTVERVGS